MGIQNTSKSSTHPEHGSRRLVTCFLAGVVVTSLLAAGLRLREREGSPVDEEAKRSASQESGVPLRPGTTASRHRTSGDAPGESSLQDLITGIKRLHAGPDHALTTLRLREFLDSIPISRIPELIALANDELDATTRAATYEYLLERWLGVDPDGALDFVLAERVGSQVDPTKGTNLLNNLFSTLVREDPEGGRAWLLDRWDHQVLGESAFLGSLRRFLAIDMTDNLLRNGGVTEAFAFIDQLPADADRLAVLLGITGDSPWHSHAMTNLPRERRLPFYEALRKLGETADQRELVQQLWRKWGEDDPSWVREVEADLGPAERFDVALAWMGVTAQWKASKPRSDGSFTSTNLGVHDRDSRVAAALEAGLAAGHSREETLEAMAQVFVERLRNESLAWFDAYRDEFDADPILAHQAREQVVASSWSGDELPPMVAIQWASRISDPSLREQLCSGAYLRLIQRDPVAARAYLDRPNAPQDLLPTFQSILSQTP